MSARPHEILNLEIKDIIFKKTIENKQYAEVLIKGGKTKSRTVPLIDSVPYVKELISNHPCGTDPESWLFLSNSNSTFGSKLSYDGLSFQYKYFYEVIFFQIYWKKQQSPKPTKQLSETCLRNRGIYMSLDILL